MVLESGSIPLSAPNDNVKNMFYSVPISNEEIIASTPIGAKCITHLFFESKNDKVFLYKEKQDSVTITIDGKMVCRDVPILPFLSSTPYGVNRHKWQDVALEIGLNVSLSEIKISASTANNDYDVVFVCADKPMENTHGFDFVEAFRIKLLYPFSGNAREEAVSYLLAEAKANESIRVGDYPEIVGTTTDNTIYEYPLTLLSSGRMGVRKGSSTSPMNSFHTGRYYFVKKESTLSNIFTGIYKEKNDDGVSLYHDGEDATYDYYRLRYTLNDEEWKYCVGQYIAYQRSYNILGEWNVEKTLSLDRSPQKMFFLQNNSSTTDLLAPKTLTSSDVRLHFSLSGGSEQEFMPNTDIEVFQCKDNLPWRNVVYTFQQQMPKAIQFTYGYNKGAYYTNVWDMNMPLQNWVWQTSFSKKGRPSTWDLYLFFLYKKII